MIGLFLGDTDFSELVLKKIKRLSKKYFIIDFSKNNKFKKDKNSYRVSIGKFGEILNLIKKNIPLSDIGIQGDPLSVVDEIRGNEPSKTFKKFKYTSLEDGIKRTIDFY